MARSELRRNLLLVACGAAGLAVNGWMAVANRSSWDVDFNQYYSAGKLVGSGRLYDPHSILSLELERNAKAVPFGRIPAFAVAFKPLSALPYPVARTLWLCIGIAALAGFVYLWPFSERAWPWIAFCWSAPAAMCLAFGQDSILFLFFAALGVKLLGSKHDFGAGLAFSACIAKPHLALLVPVFLIARLKWKAILGGVVGVTAFMMLSFAVEGKDWPQRLLTLARIPEFDPAAVRMPNLRGLLSFAGGSTAAEVVLGLAVATAVWFLSRRQPIPAVGAVVLAGGLMIGHHAYFYDSVLLLPALLLPFQSQHLHRMRIWALFLLTPMPYLLLLTNAGILGQIAIIGYTVALIAVMVKSDNIPSSALA